MTDASDIVSSAFSNVVKRVTTFLYLLPRESFRALRREHQSASLHRRIWVLGRWLARYQLLDPFPSTPRQTGRATFAASSFPFVPSDVLCLVGLPAWIA